MKVILDCDPIVAPLTGIGRYTLALAKQLKKHPQVEEIRYFRLMKWTQDPAISHSSNQLSAENSLRHFIKKTRILGPMVKISRHFYKMVWFKCFLKNVQDHIYHGPNYWLMPFSGNKIVTIHDLSCMTHPEFHPWYRTLFFRQRIARVVKKATHIIAGSQFSKKELVKLLNVSPEKITPIYYGIDAIFRPYVLQDCLPILEKYQLSYKHYCLSVATIEPRKNLKRLLDAFIALPASLRKAYPLVLVGGDGWLNQDIDEAISHLVQQGEIVKLGYVQELDLVKLYAAATLVAYPSLYEGFGLPVVEAMACGTAVISSNVSAIPEAAGLAAILVDPYSTQAISDALFTLISDEKKRDALVAAGLEQAALFTWEKCAEETIKVYSKCSR